MPIYEYTCHGCGHDVEIWQKISEKAKKVCPDCGSRKLERVISHSSFHLKGSGWYVTDYAQKRSSDASSKSSETSGKAKDAGAKKTEPSKTSSSE